MSVNDDKYVKLFTALGGGAYTGPKHIDDMELAWLQAQAGVTAEQINDAWMQYWDALTIPVGQYNDRAYAWLGGLGYTGSLSDRWAAYWRAILLLDNFTDTNGVLIENHTPDIGGPWVRRSVDNGPPDPGAITIINNQIQITDPANGAVVDAGVADAAIELSLIYATGARGGLMMRSASNGNCLSFRFRGPESAIELITWTGGTIAATDASGTYSFVDGRAYRLRATCIGNAIMAYINGSLVLQATIAAHNIATHFGFTNYGSSFNERYDDCLINDLT